MSGIQPFQFEPTHPPGEEPIDSEEESQEEESVPNFTTRIGNIEWCICGGNCEIKACLPPKNVTVVRS